jgi:hypothetical protein
MRNKPMPTPAMLVTKEDLDKIMTHVFDPRSGILRDVEQARHKDAVLSINIWVLMHKMGLDV